MKDEILHRTLSGKPIPVLLVFPVDVFVISHAEIVIKNTSIRTIRTSFPSCGARGIAGQPIFSKNLALRLNRIGTNY
jgi:hypothetical protein